MPFFFIDSNKRNNFFSFKSVLFFNCSIFASILNSHNNLCIASGPLSAIKPDNFSYLSYSSTSIVVPTLNSEVPFSKTKYFSKFAICCNSLFCIPSTNDILLL